MKKELWLVLSIVFIDMLGFGIVIPTLPFVAERFGATPSMIGLLVASFSLFQFIGSPILGRLSDQHGRKPVLAFSLFGTALGYFLIAITTSLPLIFLSRIIDGITGGNLPVAQAYIADVTEGKERTKAMGLMGAAFGFGFIFGPLIGGLLSVYGFAAPYILAGSLALLNSILILIILPESEKKATQRKAATFLSMKVIKEIMQPKIVLYLTMLFFLVTFAFSLLQGIFPLFTNRVLDWNQVHVGYFFAYIGVISAIMQGFVLRKIIHIINEKKLIAGALFVISTGFLIFSVASTPTFFFVAGFCLASSFGILNTVIQAEISHFSRPEEQGVVLGFVQGTNALARAFGPALGGFLFGTVSIRTPFLLSAILLFASAFLSMMIYKNAPHLKNT